MNSLNDTDEDVFLECGIPADSIKGIRFRSEMRGRRYGADALSQAWGWFLRGWLHGRMAR